MKTNVMLCCDISLVEMVVRPENKKSACEVVIVLGSRLILLNSG